MSSLSLIPGPQNSVPSSEHFILTSEANIVTDNPTVVMRSFSKIDYHWIVTIVQPQRKTAACVNRLKETP